MAWLSFDIVKSFKYNLKTAQILAKRCMYRYILNLYIYIYIYVCILNMVMMHWKARESAVQ